MATSQSIGENTLKVLYLSALGKKVQLASTSTVDDHTIIDMDPVRSEIATKLQQEFKTFSFDHAGEVFSSPADITKDALAAYDAFLCDLSTSNPNILFSAGIAEASGKPIIYIINSDSATPRIADSRRTINYSPQSRSEEFYNQLFQLLRLASENPAALMRQENKTKPSKAFISYSHQDKVYLDRLLVHLKPMTKAGLVDVWVDTRIKTGEKWKESIHNALETSNIAILLISADFLASDFIVDNELPPLLAQAEVNGTRIIPLILSPCRFARDKNLNRYQSANPPSRPLSAMAHDERETIYDQLVNDIEKALQIA